MSDLPRWCSIDASELESVQLAARFPDFREALSGRRLRDKLSQLIAVLAGEKMWDRRKHKFQKRFVPYYPLHYLTGNLNLCR